MAPSLVGFFVTIPKNFYFQCSTDICNKIALSTKNERIALTDQTMEYFLTITNIQFTSNFENQPPNTLHMPHLLKKAQKPDGSSENP